MTFHDPKAAAAVEPLDANAPLAFERACAELITAGSPGASLNLGIEGGGVPFLWRYQKWLVYNGKSNLKWMITGGPP